MKLVLQKKGNFLQTRRAEEEGKNSMQYETLSDDTNGKIAGGKANKNIEIKRQEKVGE